MKRPFAAQMAHEIKANKHKGKWDEWKPSTTEAYRELKHHVEKLRPQLALKRPDAALVREFAADIGNIAEKIFNEFG